MTGMKIADASAFRVLVFAGVALALLVPTADAECKCCPMLVAPANNSIYHYYAYYNGTGGRTLFLATGGYYYGGPHPGCQYSRYCFFYHWYYWYWGCWQTPAHLTWRIYNSGGALVSSFVNDMSCHASRGNVAGVGNAPGNYTVKLYCDGDLVGTHRFRMVYDDVPAPYFYNASDPAARVHSLTTNSTLFTVAWDANGNNCTIYRSVNGSGHPESLGWNCKAAGSHAAVGLPNSTYCYKAVAYDIDGNNLNSSASCITISANPNRPPPAPPVPFIQPSTLHPGGTVACTLNCPPPSCLPGCPPDADGDPVTMSYQWYVDSAVVAPWSGATSYACSGCVEGNVITMRSRACDSLGACNESGLSNQAVVATPFTPPTLPGDIRYMVLALVVAFSILALAYMATYAFELM